MLGFSMKWHNYIYLCHISFSNSVCFKVARFVGCDMKVILSKIEYDGLWEWGAIYIYIYVFMRLIQDHMSFKIALCGNNFGVVFQHFLKYFRRCWMSAWDVKYHFAFSLERVYCLFRSSQWSIARHFLSLLHLQYLYIERNTCICVDVLYCRLLNMLNIGTQWT